MTRTAFYALDQANLPRDDWDLADTFARLHAIVTDPSPSGVARITVADLMLLLEACSHVEHDESFRQHRNALSRISAALGE